MLIQENVLLCLKVFDKLAFLIGHHDDSIVELNKEQLLNQQQFEPIKSNVLQFNLKLKQKFFLN
jgi:hypothetical protein